MRKEAASEEGKHSIPGASTEPNGVTLGDSCGLCPSGKGRSGFLPSLGSFLVLTGSTLEYRKYSKF